MPFWFGYMTASNAFSAIIDQALLIRTSAAVRSAVREGDAPTPVRVIFRRPDTITDFGDARLWHRHVDRVALVLMAR